MFLDIIDRINDIEVNGIYPATRSWEKVVSLILRLASILIIGGLRSQQSLPVAAAASTPVSTALPTRLVNNLTILQKVEAVSSLMIPVEEVPQYVGRAKKEAEKYGSLLPQGFTLAIARTVAYRMDGDILVAIPVAGLGLPGGAYTFQFSVSGELLTSQQSIIVPTSSQSGRLSIYRNGKFERKYVAGSTSQGSAKVTGAGIKKVTGAGIKSASSFTKCWNNMPGWMTDLVGLMCGVGCLLSAGVMCAIFMLGLGGIYASFALKCLSQR